MKTLPHCLLSHRRRCLACCFPELPILRPAFPHPIFSMPIFGATRNGLLARSQKLAQTMTEKTCKVLGCLCVCCCFYLRRFLRLTTTQSMSSTSESGQLAILAPPISPRFGPVGTTDPCWPNCCWPPPTSPTGPCWPDCWPPLELLADGPCWQNCWPPLELLAELLALLPTMAHARLASAFKPAPAACPDGPTDPCWPNCWPPLELLAELLALLASRQLLASTIWLVSELPTSLASMGLSSSLTWLPAALASS